MGAYVARRLLAVIPVMAVVALVVFSLIYFTPGDPALIIAGDQATPDEVAHIRAALGLDRPAYIRFGYWLWRILHGDLGESIFSGQSVNHLIAQRLPPTLSLVALSVVISVSTAVPLGTMAAWRRGGIADRVLSGLTIVGFSVPTFVAGYGLAYIFASKLHMFPVQGFSPLSAGAFPFLRSLVLPAVTLSLLYTAIVAGVTQTAMTDVLGQDYIRTATAKGAPPWRVLFRHALKNASVPVVTVIGNGVAALIGGVVVIESVFAIPGLGQLTVDAVLHRDYPIIQGVVLFSSGAYVLINLAVDLSYTVLDPRIRY